MMFGATLRCPVCNMYKPDRCICPKPDTIKLPALSAHDLEVARAVLEAVATDVLSRRPWCKEIASEIRNICLKPTEPKEYPQVPEDWGPSHRDDDDRGPWSR